MKAEPIILRHQLELEQRRKAMAKPEVRKAIQRKRERAVSASTAERKQKWRAGRGYGPGERRHTGD